MRNWLVSGWEMFNFIITPVELENCLMDFHLIINNAHVLVDYIESPMQEYISVYEQLFKKLVSGEKLVWKEDHPLLSGTGLTRDLGRCEYNKIHEYQGGLYKQPDFDEPCVNMAPFTLYVLKDRNGNPSISTRVSYSQYPENVVGLELSYPKKIQFKSPEAEQYGLLESTKDLNAYQDFLLLKNSIQKITKPLSFKLDCKLVRTKVRISEQALQLISKFYFFKSHRIAEIIGAI